MASKERQDMTPKLCWQMQKGSCRFFFLTFISRSGSQSRCQSELILWVPAGGSRVSWIGQMCSEVHLSGRIGYYHISERHRRRERESPNIAGVLLPLWSPTLAGQRGEYDTSLPPTSVYDYHPLLLYNSEDCTPTHTSHAPTSPHTHTHTQLTAASSRKNNGTREHLIKQLCFGTEEDSCDSLFMCCVITFQTLKQSYHQKLRKHTTLYHINAFRRRNKYDALQTFINF